MKARFLLLSFLISITSIIAYSQQPVKRVLLEQHTGAWCGYCVDGTVVMDQILEQYPDQVIGIKVHNGDNMAIPEEQTIATDLGLTGFPTAAIDRVPYGGKIFIDRSTWLTAVDQQLQTDPKIDLTVTYQLDKVKRVLTATVRGKVLIQLNDPLKFNLLIMEDSCSGSGTGWDQSNYYNTTAGHPYFGKGNPIKNYQHMKVVRKFVGGPYGEDVFANLPALAGEEYVQTFEFPIDQSWNIERIYCIGLAQVYSSSNKEILNCAYGVVGDIIPKANLSYTGSNMAACSNGMSFDKIFTVTNSSSNKKTYKIALVKSSRTPSDWQVKLNNEVDLLNVDGGSSADFTVSFIPGATKGIGDAQIVVYEQSDSPTPKAVKEISCISSEIDKFLVFDKATESKYNFDGYLKKIPMNDVFTISFADYDAFSPVIKSSNLVIYDGGTSTGFNSNTMATIKNLIDNKVKVVVTGAQAITGMYTSPDFNDVFGINYMGYNVEGFGSSPWPVWLTGIEDDPISGFMGTDSTKGNLISYLLPQIEIVDPSTTTPILRFKHDGRYVTPSRDTINVEAGNSIFGVKVEKNGTRYVLMGFNPFVIADANRRSTLIGNAVKWVMNMTDIHENTSTETKFTISPTPIKDEATITFTDSNSGSSDVNVVIYDLNGNKVMALPGESCSEGLNTIKFSTSGMINGTYYAIVNDGKNIIKIPVVVVH